MRSESEPSSSAQTPPCAGAGLRPRPRPRCDFLTGPARLVPVELLHILGSTTPQSSLITNEGRPVLFRVRSRLGPAC
ncbi:unnamed protein product [Danaus chrysippus]|uniref:(African queen) hypothetical protein n=1 Tax=Danaus chrysippus TaxID=151541 RepID=A0A8J2WAW5_9NEOP|nr:unnamed protein product [Danaus chrysippus]